MNRTTIKSKISFATMQRSILSAFAAFCLTGCHHSNPVTGKSGNAGGSGFSSPNPDEPEIKLAVYDYIVRELLSPATNRVFFISLREDRIQLMRSALPGYRLKPASEAEYDYKGVRDRNTKELGTSLASGRIRIEANTAWVNAGWRQSKGGGVIFRIELVKDEKWRVVKVSEPSFFD